MAAREIRTDESLALVLAALAHAALFAWLAIQRPAPPPPLPERMTVTLSEDLAPVSTSPEPQADPAPDTGPVLGEALPPPEPEPIATPEPRPSPTLSPRPVARPSPKPSPPPPKPATKQPAPKAAPKVVPKQPPKQPGKPGASRFDDAFGSGVPGTSGKQPPKNPPAAAPSAQLRASWSSSINARVLRPWNACAPSGLDGEKLRVMVQFSLDRFGEIATMSAPVVSGITEANRPQADAYEKCAVRAIRVSAPFDNLPAEFYEHWKLRKLTFRKE